MIGRYRRIKEKIGLQKWDVALTFLFAAAIWARVIVHGHQASDGLLGRPLRVGIVAWPGYAGGLVANNGLDPSKDSYFWSRNLFVKFVIEDGEQLQRDFIRGGDDGGVDVMWSTVDSLAQQLPDFEKEGVHPRAFMQVDWSRGGDVIVTQKRISSIEKLVDTKVAVSMAASLFLLEDSLENSSLSDEQKQKIRLARVQTSGSKAAYDEFVSHHVDAAVLWEPYVQEAINQRSDAHKLVSTSTFDNLIADVMVAKEEFLQDSRGHDVIRAFIEGWLLDGTPKAIGDPMSAVKALQAEDEFANLLDETVHELITKTGLATLKDNENMFGLAGGEIFFDHLFNRASRIWVKGGYITVAANARQARDTHILEEVYRDTIQSHIACSQEILTKAVPVKFPPGIGELLPEARSALDDEDISILLRTRPGTRFCVEVIPGPGDEPQRASEIRRARENAVITYLVSHYDRPRSQFIAASDSTDDATGSGSPEYIRLRINSLPWTLNPSGSRSPRSGFHLQAGDGI